jgi:TolA-binding protein
MAPLLLCSKPMKIFVFRESGMKLHHWLYGAALAVIVVPAQAQDANVEGRVGKLEKEMKAVQRKVFPEGAGKFFEPEIKPDEATKTGGASSTTAVADLIARVDAMETQLATLTGQVEQQGTKMRGLEAQLKSLDAQVKALRAADGAVDTPPSGTNGTVPVTPMASKPVAVAAKPAATSPKPSTAAKPSATRTAAVAAIQKPSTGDGFADGYDFGYRLWEAKYYPEAQVQLEETVKKYPKHKRISYARNLLGRAWLDDGKPATAVKILYDNYTTQPDGDRAPESLYFVGIALNQLGKVTEACKAFDSVEKEYPDAVTSRLSARLVEGRKKAKCK